jgi:hypothetical protein
MSDEDRDALELIGTWCHEHGTRLAALSTRVQLRGKKSVAPSEPKPPPLTVGELKERYDRRRVDAAQKRTADLADDFVMYIRNSRTFPVKRREVIAALDVSPSVLQRAANLAISRGDIVSVRRGGPHRSGYFTPEAAPSDMTNAEAA